MARRGIATIAINVVGHGCGPLGTLTVNRTAGSPVDAPRRRPRDRPGRQRRDRLDRGRQRGAAVDARRQPRRPAPDRDRPDAARAARSRSGWTSTATATRDLDASPDLVLRPVVRRHLRHEVPRRRAERARRRPERPRRRDHRDRPAQPGLPRRSSGSASSAGHRRWRTCRACSSSTRTCRCGTCRRSSTRCPGASAIQQLIEWTEWAPQAGNPVAYAPHLRADPLAGVPAKSIILQFARGDQTVPNPTTSAIIRAGALADRTTLFRNDLAFAANPTLPEEPAHVPDAHRRASPCRSPAPSRSPRRIRSPQFFASGGTTVVDPDGAGAALRDADGRRHRRRIWPTSRELDQ